MSGADPIKTLDVELDRIRVKRPVHNPGFKSVPKFSRYLIMYRYGTGEECLLRTYDEGETLGFGINKSDFGNNFSMGLCCINNRNPTKLQKDQYTKKIEIIDEIKRQVFNIIKDEDPNTKITMQSEIMEKLSPIWFKQDDKSIFYVSLNVQKKYDSDDVKIVTNFWHPNETLLSQDEVMSLIGNKHNPKFTIVSDCCLVWDHVMQNAMNLKLKPKVVECVISIAENEAENSDNDEPTTPTRILKRTVEEKTPINEKEIKEINLDDEKLM